MSEQAERRVGTIIGGKWRVDALLGSGSMAAVYSVTHRNGARAALKILHPTLCTDPSVCERFLGEGYLANSVKHSGIVRVLDDGVTDDGCVFLTMDLLEGDTLEDLRVKRGNKIPVQEALDLADMLMDVLSAVHAAGIIHRDLKPQNVFVCNDGVLKLLDFGVARVFDRTAQSKLSMFGLVLGTPSFMSPEQALGSRDKVDHRSDIWSFGATLFTALTGETVHLGANVPAKLLAAATVKARSISMVMPSLPPAIAAAIDTALRFKKEDRWQSADVMRRAFRDARDTSGLKRPAEPVRAFDMSLDESTHVDKGGPKAFAKTFDGERTQRIDSEPPEGPSGTFIGIGKDSVVGGDIPAPPAFMTNPQRGASAPPAKSSVPPPVPMRGRMPSAHGPPTPGIPFQSNPPGPGPRPASAGSYPPPGALGPSRSAGPAPAGVIRRPPTADPMAPFPAIGSSGAPGAGASPMRSSRPDGQEGSIPAYGNTLNFGAEDSVSDIDPSDLGIRRKSSVGVWLMAVLLAAAALGGIAFFAVRRAPSTDPSNGSDPRDPRNPATAVSSATPPPPTSMLPTTAIVSPTLTTPPPDVNAGVKDASIGTPTPPAVTPTPPVRLGLPGRGTNPGGGHGPRTSRPTTTALDPAATPTTDPRPTPPGLAPDPFGTPE